MFIDVGFIDLISGSLKVALEQEANKGVKMYYNDSVPGIYYEAFESADPIFRRIYDLTYKYAKQTLAPEDIVFLHEEKLGVK